MNPYSPPAAAYSAPSPVTSAGNPGAVSDVAIELLRQTRPWVVFLSILAFLGSAFMILGGILVVGVGLAASGAKGMEALLGLFYIPLGLVYIYPGIKMWAYGAAIGRLLQSRVSGDLEEALSHQKSFWKFSGIAAIVLVVLYVVLIFVAVAVGVATQMGKIHG